MRLLLLCIVALALCPWSLHAQPNCTEADYKASYTECSSFDLRDLVYYKKANSNCTGGVPAPAPIYNLQCDIACQPGSYLPMGETECAACEPGTFSIGGGYRIDSWYSWPDDIQINRYMYNTSNKTVHITTPGSPQWSLQDTFIRSGNITHLQASVFELSVYIASIEGHVSFSYRVNAEYLPPFNYDGLQFEVDGVTLLSKTSHTSNYVTATYPLKFGAHVLTWSYIKDFSENKGEDAAFIRMIEIAGIKYSDDHCTPCPEGTYSSKSNATVCLPCPANTYSDTLGASVCKECDEETEYSYSEAANCTLRQPCKQDDYESFYEPCIGGYRKLVYSWITPVICNENSREGVQLPQDQERLPCGNCTDGTYRNPTTYACDYCADGLYSNISTHGVCTSCPAGTAAVKTFAVTQFDDWVAGYSTNCSGDCSNQGWEIHSSSMDSGIGHGSTVNSWFQFNVSLVEPGILTFMYSIACPSAQCSLSLSVGSDAPIVYAAPKPKINSEPVRLTAGNHSLNWTFSKYDYGTSRNDAAYIYNIFISSTTVGGAINCTTCPNGSYSAANAKQCIPCDAGQQSNQAHTACEACPAGTFNERPGGVCLPCGQGTTPFPNATGCFITCAYSPENTTALYNLTHLRSTNSSYGPVKDQNQQSYYINICATQPHQCYSAKDTPIDSYACQETRGKIVGTDVPEGKDIGHVLGWHPLPKNNSYKTDLGVVMSLGYGDIGCGGRYRDTNITFVCDPAAGEGAPVPYNGNQVESLDTKCHYAFLWRSLYACPICDVNVDMAFYYSPCQEGIRTKTYYWLKNPPLCHSGQLPEPVVVNCSETDTVCAPGQYLEDGVNCISCRAGSYSVGGGERIMSWTKMPAHFSTACTPTSTCTKWKGDIDGVETITSGNGDSTLTALFDYIVDGSISFDYKLFSPNAGKFMFTIDTKEQLDIPTGVNKLGWNHVSIPVPKGVHTFVWTFLAGSEANETTPRVGAVLREVTIIGTDYHDDACTPCPAGFRSAANASACIACGLDHFSSAPDSEVCTACPPTTTALHRATSCVPRPACTDADIVTLHTACVNNTRTQYSAFLYPKFCANTTALPANQTVSCAPCLNGSFPDPNAPGNCAVCPLGEFYSGGKCGAAPAGSVAVKKRFYFADNSTDTLPHGLTTSCSGDCGTSGWRVVNAAIESGYHSDHAVDSWLRLQVQVINGFGTIEFDYEASSKFDFYIDGKYITSLANDGQYSADLAEGNHTITWNYHQHKLDTGYATLSNIVVTGVVDDAAGSFVEKCPEGSYSAQNSSSCTLCPPGTFAHSEGSQECNACPPLTYSSEYGSTECLGCGSNSYSNGSAQFCTNDNCHYTTKIGDRTVFFNLNDTNTLGPIHAQNSDFYFNFCNASLVSAPCDPKKPAHACAVEEGTQNRNWGGYLTFNSTHTPVVSGSDNTSFQISFAYGDSNGCPANTKRSAVFNFLCNVREPTSIEYDAASSDECIAVFEWSGRAGCPVCDEQQDYTTLLGQCVDGMRTVQKQRSADCNGDDIIAAPSQSCSGTVEFPIAVVFIVIGVVLVLVAVAVVVFIKNRRITAQYGRLKQQSDHMALENENDNDNL